MNKQLVIFVTTPLIKRDIKIYGVDYYQNKGLTIFFFNLWPLFSKGLTHKTDIDYKNQININSIRSLVNALIKFKRQNSIFLSDVSIGNKSFILYLILTLLHIEYNFVDNWYAIQPKIKIKRNFYQKLKRIPEINLQILPRLFDYYIAIFKKKIFHIFLKKPKYVFMPTKKSFHSKAIAGRKTKIVPYSSFNYDDFIATKEDNSTSLIKTTDYFVFIDQYLTNLPDFDRDGIKTPLTNKYYDSLNNCFIKIKKSKSLEYIVAAHPRRDIENLNIFETKYVFIYKTYELIKNANFIIAHYSNSIYWAILLNKPVILIKTNEMKGTFIEDLIDAFAIELQQKVYNIDEEKYMINSDDLIVNKSIYEQFKSDHIVFNPNSFLKTYEIIYKTIFLNE